MKRKLFAVLMIVIMCASIVTGCGPSDSKNKLYLYNWTEYIPQSVFEAFEKETGIKVVESTFSSNEELLAKLTAGGTSQYDMAIASNYIIKSMISQNLIQKIDKSKITNIGNLSKEVMGLPFDKNNDYTIPYMSTMTLIAVNKKKCKELGVEIKSFNDLLNPALKNNIVVVDDAREIIGVALKAQGQDANSKDQAVIKGTLPWLKKLIPNIKSYDSDSPKTALISNEVAVGIVYNLDAGVAIKENKDIDVVFTQEPCALSIDNFVITSGAKNKENAERFIDFIMRADIYKMILDTYPGVCINDAAKALLDDDYLKNAGSNVDPAQIAKATLIDDVGDAVETYDEVFTQMKTN